MVNVYRKSKRNTYGYKKLFKKKPILRIDFRHTTRLFFLNYKCLYYSSIIYSY
jgi:hypothetical protein